LLETDGGADRLRVIEDFQFDRVYWNAHRRAVAF
jgi:hypothetical protein